MLSPRERFAAFSLLVLATALPALAADDIIPLEQSEPGMRGVARTIFAGQEIEEFPLEVLGVLRNIAGPGQHLILVRLLGEKARYTGVVAGMSGSPVYFDGKLAGALAFRFGIFTKEPIGGVTPIANMLQAVAEEPPQAAAGADTSEPLRYPVPQDLLARAGVPAAHPYLVPIETPLTFVGFHPQVIHQFSEELAAQGLLAVQGGGSAAPERTSSLEPGGAVAAALVTGDMSIAGTCTITRREGDRLYACGHPMLGFGDVQLPMTRAEIVTTVPSEFSSFKIANIGEVVGSFQQDRSTAIVGRLGPGPAMIPVDLTLVHHGRRRSRNFHFQIFQHPRITPTLLAFTLLNGLFNTTEAGAELTYRVHGRLALRGHTDVVLSDMFSPTDSFVPDAFFVASSVSTAFQQIFANPFETPEIEGLSLQVE
ncbi:MAG: hypothetical protein ACE5HB_00870, partial [Terriglobia bacterium]